jgi:hypothetical protein
MIITWHYTSQHRGGFADGGPAAAAVPAATVTRDGAGPGVRVIIAVSSFQVGCVQVRNIVDERWV